MNAGSEILYRAVFGALWVIYFGVRLFFQGKVKSAGRGYVLQNEQQEKRYFRLFALAYVLLPLYFLPSWVDFTHLGFPVWLRWAGAGLTVLGILLFAWAHQALGVNWTAVLALSEEQELVTSGPYRWVRHPMYTAFLVIGFGFWFLSANGLVGLIYFSTLLLMVWTRLPAEEEMMVERFGERYRAYQKTTGSLLPRFKK